MKYLTILTFVLMSQVAFTQFQEPFVESTGYFEKEVIPNEIYIKFKLEERMDGKTKITLANLENELRDSLLEVGLNLSDLTLSDAKAEYVRVSWNIKDVLSEKEYIIMVKNAQELGQVFNVMDMLKVRNAYVDKVDHSEIEKIRKEVRINAILNAKDKADYMLLAIDEKVGKTLLVRGDDLAVRSPGIYQVAGQMQAVPGVRMSSYELEDKYSEIQFQKIKIESKIYAKFSIIKH